MDNISKEKRRLRTEYLNKMKAKKLSVQIPVTTSVPVPGFAKVLKNANFQTPFNSSALFGMVPSVSPSNSDNESVKSDGHSTPFEMDADEKKELRKIRNRESALLSRKRKSEEVENLNIRVDTLESEVASLRKRLAAYEGASAYSPSKDEKKEFLGSSNKKRTNSNLNHKCGETAVLTKKLLLERENINNNHNHNGLLFGNSSPELNYGLLMKDTQLDCNNLFGSAEFKI